MGKTGRQEGRNTKKDVFVARLPLQCAGGNAPHRSQIRAMIKLAQRGVDPPTASQFSVSFVMAMTSHKTIKRRNQIMQNNVTIEEWIALLRETGLDDAAMKLWHRLFESRHPAGHQGFLEWLGLDAARIEQIRAAHR
jgi:hypothetical protein